MATSKGWTDFAILKSSKPGVDGTFKEWKVQVHEDGTFRCNCPSYIFSKAKPRTCKHCTKCFEDRAVELKAKGITVTPGRPLQVEAQAMFDAMVAAADKHGVRRFHSIIGAAITKAMVDTLAMKLALFNPNAVATVQLTEIQGVRRITFDD